MRSAHPWSMRTGHPATGCGTGATTGMRVSADDRSPSRGHATCLEHTSGADVWGRRLALTSGAHGNCLERTGTSATPSRAGACHNPSITPWITGRALTPSRGHTIAMGHTLAIAATVAPTDATPKRTCGETDPSPQPMRQLDRPRTWGADPAQQHGTTRDSCRRRGPQASQPTEQPDHFAALTCRDDHMALRITNTPTPMAGPATDANNSIINDLAAITRPRTHC